ncbi:hypothetical protein EYF80_003294 [Liparis tanakae]|uniref:Uncharacterized protein n=1 Tax=Liparis tanakae TaxID=230148 RepID=A0A4Z2J9Q6_9TELE|nr:hypothetical protein EYF80_003294 [Liparis tanakae]
MNCARVDAGGVTAKEASLAAANLGIHQFIIPYNQSTNAALPFLDWHHKGRLYGRRLGVPLHEQQEESSPHGVSLQLDKKLPASLTSCGSHAL